MWPCVGWLRAQSQTTSPTALRAESVSRFSSLISPHKASPYSMEDSDPRKFFMSGERMWVMTKGLGMCPEGID